MIFMVIFIPLLNSLFLGYHINVNPILLSSIIKVLLSYNLILLNTLCAFLFINISCLVNVTVVEVLSLRLNSLSLLLSIIVVMVSSVVILASINYLSSNQIQYFILLLSCFQFVMIMFVLSMDLLLLFISWELLGLVSYLLINIFPSKLNSGIKAVIYNKVGDLCFLMTLAFSYSLYPFINYSPFLPLTSYIIFIMFESSLTLFLSLSLIIIFFSKSAQLPLSSWLLNAMSAPTPVSSLLHSSTMVIAGVYLGLIMQPIIIIDCFSFILLIVPLYSLIWSIFKAISLSDMKSMIAFSTISQISYMFLAIYGASTLVSLFHIIIHALFKSLLFLLSGSLIHGQSNFQSIYKLKINHSFINIIFILAGSVLIVSLSKEGIIHSSNCILSSAFVTMIAVIGGIFTMIYTLKIYWSLSLYSSFFILSSFSLYSSSSSYFLSFSFLLPWLTISSIFIDQSLEYFFSISCSLIYYSIDFSSLLSVDYILDFSLVFFVFIISIILSFIRFFLLYFDGYIFILFIFSSRSTFFVLPFQYFYLLYSCFFFKSPIHLIEVYTGLNSYCYSSLYLVIFFFFLFFIFLFFF